MGKTVVAAALVLGLRQRGVRAVGFKPVETGIDSDEVADSFVLRAASGQESPLLLPLLRLREPLAPAVAAERAGSAFDPDAAGSRIQALRAAGYSLVVEGAGGLLVPLAWGFTALDLAVQSGLDAVVVARAGLGTLNHIALTLEALARRNVRVQAVVLNGQGDPPDLAEATNPAALARLFPEVRLVVLPRLPTTAPLAAARVLSPLLLEALPA